MKRSAVYIFVAVFLLFFFRLLSQKDAKPQAFQQLYDKAEALFYGNATDSTDSIALTYYTNITIRLKPDSANATLLYNCYERSGILKQGLSYKSPQILHDYYAALNLQRQFHLSDSILFRLLLSAGNVHYVNGSFDSSVYYFSWAERIINHYPSAGLAGDLYNSLGALYSEAGDYVQSGNYFNKALELTEKNRPDLKDAIFAMSANIASALRLSGNPDSSLVVYKRLQKLKPTSVAIANNISGVFLSRNQPDSALHYLQLPGEFEGNDVILMNNSLAQAYLMKNDTAKAAYHLNIAAQCKQQTSPHLKNSYYAATCKFLGDLMMIEMKPEAALVYYQKAAIQYDYKFNDENVYHNPGNFAGDFADYSLFDVLIAKANSFVTLYNQQKKRVHFGAAVTTFDSAFALTDYIKKSIDNDEARLFIADKVFSAYAKAVDFLIANNAKNDQNEIIHALDWASKSRSASLAISLKENSIKKYAGLPDSLLQKEKNVQITISRLKLQLQQSTDSASQKKLVSEINTQALKLQSLNNDFKSYPAYYNQKFSTDNVDINSIQKKILDKQTAAICYFKGSKNLHVFIVKHDAVEEKEIVYDSLLTKSINEFTDNLSGSNIGAKYNSEPAKYLYEYLFQPLTKELAGINSLIIIPDEDLVNIPFEAFKKNNGEYLLQDYAVTYQYALPFLQKDDAVFTLKSAVAFAPYASSDKHAEFAVLSSSAKEISLFPKQSQFLNNEATKNKFLSLSNGASVIHLATHAAVNFDQPYNSYIAFYKNDQHDSDYKMYAHELYNLELPQTQLIFLSACETGSGKISRSEGALSLSRAFAFAGCPNIVTSLWKAEDKSTAYISERFYNYLAEGYTYTEALQKAKKDLLQDETMSQFHTPNYWAHLVFIGDVQQKKLNTLTLVAIIIVTFVALAVVIYKWKKLQRITS